MQVRLRECLGGHFSCLSFHRQCHVNKWAELCVSFYGAGNLRKQVAVFKLAVNQILEAFVVASHFYTKFNCQFVHQNCSLLMTAHV